MLDVSAVTYSSFKATQSVTKYTQTEPEWTQTRKNRSLDHHATAVNTDVLRITV